MEEVFYSPNLEFLPRLCHQSHEKNILRPPTARCSPTALENLSEIESEEEIEMDELEQRMWNDRMRLKRMKEHHRTNNPNRSRLDADRHCQSKEQARRKKMSRAQDGILRYMLKMMEVCKAQGFVYGIIPEKGKPVSGASDNLRAWWKDRVRFDRNGPAAIGKYHSDNSISVLNEDTNSGGSTSHVLQDLQDTTHVFQTFAEKVRDNKQLESRWAILQETRVEYFRGKDFVSFFTTQPELKEILASDKDLETDDIANTLLHKNLLVRCDRTVKTLRPGKKKLSSWPKHLEIHQDQVFSENDAFFAWTFMKRRTIWQTILSFLWPLVALALCLFPVYPYQCKIVVLYSCAGTLLFIMSLLVVRAMIFGALWVILGKSVWFFPNINAEEITFRELIRFWPKKEEGERPKWTSRLTYAAVTLIAILLLRQHAPDEAARARYQKRVSNIIDDVLEWDPRLALSGIMEGQENATNATNTTDNPTNDSRGQGITVETPNEHSEEQSDINPPATNDVGEETDLHDEELSDARSDS